MAINYVRTPAGGFMAVKDVVKQETRVAERPDTAALARLLGLDKPEPAPVPMPEPVKVPEPKPAPKPVVVVSPQAAPRVRMSLAESAKSKPAPSTGGKICTLTGAPLGACPSGPQGCVPGDAAGWSGKADF